MQTFLLATGGIELVGRDPFWAHLAGLDYGTAAAAVALAPLISRIPTCALPLLYRHDSLSDYERRDLGEALAAARLAAAGDVRIFMADIQGDLARSDAGSFNSLAELAARIEPLSIYDGSVRQTVESVWLSQHRPDAVKALSARAESGELGAAFVGVGGQSRFRTPPAHERLAGRAVTGTESLLLSRQYRRLLDRHHRGRLLPSELPSILPGLPPPEASLLLDAVVKRLQPGTIGSFGPEEWEEVRAFEVYSTYKPENYAYSAFKGHFGGLLMVADVLNVHPEVLVPLATPHVIRSFVGGVNSLRLAAEGYTRLPDGHKKLASIEKTRQGLEFFASNALLRAVENLLSRHPSSFRSMTQGLMEDLQILDSNAGLVDVIGKATIERLFERLGRVPIEYPPWDRRTNIPVPGPRVGVLMLGDRDDKPELAAVGRPHRLLEGILWAIILAGMTGFVAGLALKSAVLASAMAIAVALDIFDGRPSAVSASRQAQDSLQTRLRRDPHLLAAYRELLLDLPEVMTYEEAQAVLRAEAVASPFSTSASSD